MSEILLKLFVLAVRYSYKIVSYVFTYIYISLSTMSHFIHYKWWWHVALNPQTLNENMHFINKEKNDYGFVIRTYISFVKFTANFIMRFNMKNCTYGKNNVNAILLILLKIVFKPNWYLNFYNLIMSQIILFSNDRI